MPDDVLSVSRLPAELRSAVVKFESGWTLSCPRCGGDNLHQSQPTVGDDGGRTVIGFYCEGCSTSRFGRNQPPLDLHIVSCKGYTSMTWAFEPVPKWGREIGDLTWMVAQAPGGNLTDAQWDAVQSAGRFMIQRVLDEPTDER